MVLWLHHNRFEKCLSSKESPIKEEKMLELQKSNQYQVITPHGPNDILDMGVWFQKVKVSIPATEMTKIQEQREKLTKVLTPTPLKKITYKKVKKKLLEQTKMVMSIF